MRKYLLISLGVFLFINCIGTKRYTKFAETKIHQREVTENFESNYIIFDMSNLENKSDSIVCTKLNSLFIPAILYWQWDNTIKCEINSKIVGNYFVENFKYYADSVKLNDKLKGKILEIKLENLPNSFLYTDRGNVVIFIIAYAMTSLEAIYPQKENFVINYKLIENGDILKEDRIIIENNDQPLKNIWKTPKKFTWAYIAQFQENINEVARQVCSIVLDEI